MATKTNTYVGVELTDAEIRVAAMTLRGDKIMDTKVAYGPVPGGAFARGLVQHPGAMAAAIKGLLNAINVDTDAKVVFGVNAEHVAVRVLPVPPVPDDELPIIVAGEVEHFGLVRSAGGGHAFFKFVAPSRMGEVPQANVAIMGIEAEVNGPLAQIADGLGMDIEAIETTPLASLRCALTALGGQGGALVVILGKTSSEIIPVVRGSLIGYRRLETGSRALLPNAAASGPSLANPTFVASEVQNLTLEVRRTLEFYRREYPDLPTADKVVLCLDDDRLLELGSEIQTATGVETMVLDPGKAGWTAEGSSPRYVAAAGLAMHGRPSALGHPKVDFFARHRAHAADSAVKRNFMGSIVVSMLAVAAGAVGFYLYNQQITTREMYVKSWEDRSVGIKQEVDSIKAERQTAQTRLNALRRDGLPLPIIMEYIVGSVGPGIGITSVTATPDLKVTITGEAVDENAMLNMVANLQSCPIISNVQVTSFSRPSPPVGDAVVFQLTGRTVTLDRIKTLPKFKETN